MHSRVLTSKYTASIDQGVKSSSPVGNWADYMNGLFREEEMQVSNNYEKTLKLRGNQRKWKL